MHYLQSREFKLERDAQPALYDFYARQGLVVDRSAACKGFDVLLTKRIGGRSWRVEEKVRHKEAMVCGDCFVELRQDLVDGSEGWFFYTTAEVLSYSFFDPDEERLLSVRMVRINELRKAHRRVALREQKHYLHRLRIASEGWGLTLNAGLRWSEIQHVKTWNLTD